jgi:hypothetical protein
MTALMNEQFPQDENKMDPEVAEFVREFLETMLTGKDRPHCHTPLERKRQVGCCVYGVPVRYKVRCDPCNQKWRASYNQAYSQRYYLRTRELDPLVEG